MKLEKEKEEENLTFTLKYTVLSLGCLSSINDGRRREKTIGESRKLRWNLFFPHLASSKEETHCSLCLPVFSCDVSCTYTGVSARSLIIWNLRKKEKSDDGIFKSQRKEREERKEWMINITRTERERATMERTIQRTFVVHRDPNHSEMSRDHRVQPGYYCHWHHSERTTDRPLFQMYRDDHSVRTSSHKDAARCAESRRVVFLSLQSKVTHFFCFVFHGFIRIGVQIAVQLVMIAEKST